MVAKGDGAHVGSLSGGCVEEDFLDRLMQGEYTLSSVVIRYGGASEENRNPSVKLPCGGALEVLVEKRSPESHFVDQLRTLLQGLSSGEALEREVDVARGSASLNPVDDHGSRVVWEQGSIECACNVFPWVAKHHLITQTQSKPGAGVRYC